MELRLLRVDIIASANDTDSAKEKGMRRVTNYAEKYRRHTQSNVPRIRSGGISILFGIAQGMRPNLYIEGRYCICSVAECDKPISRGDQGKANLIVILLKGDKELFKLGTKFELREGPIRSLAQCEIIEDPVWSSE